MTGVQTCALPISPVHKPLLDNLREDMENPAGNSAGAGDGQIERLDAEGEDHTNKNNNASSTVLNADRKSVV